MNHTNITTARGQKGNKAEFDTSHICDYLCVRHVKISPKYSKFVEIFWSNLTCFTCSECKFWPKIQFFLLFWDHVS